MKAEWKPCKNRNVHSSQHLCLFPSLTLYFSLSSEEPKEQCVVGTVTIADTDGEVLSSEYNSNTEDSQPEGKTHRNQE